MMNTVDKTELLAILKDILDISSRAEERNELIRRMFPSILKAVPANYILAILRSNKSCEWWLYSGNSGRVKKFTLACEDCRHADDCIISEKNTQRLQVTGESVREISEVVRKHFGISLDPYRSISSRLDTPDRCLGCLCFFAESTALNALKETAEEIAFVISSSLTGHDNCTALAERIKELTCLYEMVKISGKTEKSPEETLEKICAILPKSLMYPGIAEAKINLGGSESYTPGFRDVKTVMRVPVKSGEKVTGEISVGYRKNFKDNPFLEEERNLLEAVAKETANIIEKKRAEKEKRILEEQIRHADRLATIGELASGVAHELNEPLSHVLGFAQLVLKSMGKNDAHRDDVVKIENAALYARDIIKQLLIFARQAPPDKKRIDVNKTLKSAMCFLEARCAKDNIEVCYELDEDLPGVTADQSQMNQVIINLAVNAIQAMSSGGRLTIRTSTEKRKVFIEISDTGVGMSAEIKKNIFMPFFTTKKIGEGTGLGLAVVHGIVSSHNGEIKIRSRPGKGTTFRVMLPLA